MPTVVLYTGKGVAKLEVLVASPQAGASFVTVGSKSSLLRWPAGGTHFPHTSQRRGYATAVGAMVSPGGRDHAGRRHGLTAFDGPTLSPTIVGRASALEALGRALAEANAGQSRTVLISGEAGIGKSRVLAEIKKRAERMGFAVLQGTCFEPDRTMPFAPILDLFRVGAAAGLVEPIGSPLSDGEEKRQLFRRWSQSLRHLASRMPTLIAVEDIHWSDDASLECVEHFAREIGGQPVLLLLTYRSEGLEPPLRHLLAELDRQRLAAELRLRPLTREETGEMLRAILGADRPAPAGLLETIYPLTEGNPFFVEEVLASLIATGGFVRFDAATRASRMSELPIPRTVQDWVRRRTAKLRPATRQTLSLAAVAGHRFDFTLLATLQRCEERELLEQIKELIQAQLVVEVSADEFAFRHALTRHAVYFNLLARERKVLHREMAEVIERTSGDSIDLCRADLARHFFEAGVWDKALENARLAGEQALSLYAPWAAIEEFTRALEAAARLGRKPPLELHRARGQAHEMVGDFERGRSDYEQALALAQAARDRQAEWRALLDLGGLWASRDLARCGEYCQQALDLARAVSEPAAQARA